MPPPSAGKIPARSPVWWGMNQRLLITSLALGLLVLALGGWLVQAVRWPSRTLVTSYR